MHMLPWRNPLVATALQTRNRRGGLYATPVLYILLLAVAGMGVAYWASLPDNLGRVQPTEVYFFGLMTLQLAIGVIGVGSKTSASIKAEVVNKTLDFQRLASVSGWDILVGKLFGEPAMSFLLIFASFPLALFCMIYGLPGLDLPVLLLIYLSLFTTAVMFGTFSLQNTLVIPAGKATGGAVAGFGILVGLGALAALQLAAAGGTRFFTRPWSGALAGLFTPVPTLFALSQGDAWAARLGFFDWELPFLLVTPVVQVLVSLLCLHVMARRVENLAQPILGKAAAYAFLLATDILVAGVLHASRAEMPLAPRLVIFCLFHFIASMTVLGAVTPNREMLLSWLWRLRGRRPRWLDEWLGDRTLNTLAALTAAALLAAGVLLQDRLEGDPLARTMTIQTLFQPETERSVDEVVPRMLLVVPLLLLFTGVLYQWFLLVAGKYGSGLFLIALLVLVAGPAALGSYQADLQGQRMPDNLWLALSPFVHFIAWAGGPMVIPSPWPILAVYGAMTIALLVGVYRRTGQLARSVDGKLAAMGVADAQAPPGTK